MNDTWVEVFLTAVSVILLTAAIAFFFSAMRIGDAIVEYVELDEVVLAEFETARDLIGADIINVSGQEWYRRSVPMHYAISFAVQHNVYSDVGLNRGGVTIASWPFGHNITLGHFVSIDPNIPLDRTTNVFLWFHRDTFDSSGYPRSILVVY